MVLDNVSGKSGQVGSSFKPCHRGFLLLDYLVSQSAMQTTVFAPYDLRHYSSKKCRESRTRASPKPNQTKPILVFRGGYTLNNDFYKIGHVLLEVIECIVLPS